MYKNVLVAINGSEQPYRALEQAVAIAEKFGSELTILTVVPKMVFPVFPHGGFYGFPRTAFNAIFQAQDSLKAFYQDLLTDAEAKVRSEHADLSVCTILMVGRPSASIVDVAEKGGYDLIVMGSRGKKGVIGWFQGSTSKSVIDSCTGPVLVVR